MGRLDDEFDVIRESDFFLAIVALKVGLIDALFGPQGGIFVLDDHECLVYHRPHIKYQGVYLSADNIMSSHWKWLLDRCKRAKDITPAEESPKPSQDSADKTVKEAETPKERFGTMEFDSDGKSHMNN